jgi:Flp pilus assembly protein TadG
MMNTKSTNNDTLIQQPGISSARKRGQKGSQILEFGFTILPLFGFIFLIVDISWAIFAQVTLQSAVRDGVRYAITGQTMSGMGQDNSIKTVVQNSAVGFLAGNTGLSQVVIKYYAPGTLAETNSNAGGNIVEVSISGFKLTPLGPILHSAAPVALSAIASDVVEPSPAGIPPAR